MEEPNPNSNKPFNLDRWDNPMVQINFGEDINFEAIYNNLIEGKKPRDPVSTKNVEIVIYPRTALSIQISYSNWTQLVRI
jgi:hypothetical protein